MTWTANLRAPTSNTAGMIQAMMALETRPLTAVQPDALTLALRLWDVAHRAGQIARAEQLKEHVLELLELQRGLRGPA